MTLKDTFEEFVDKEYQSYRAKMCDENLEPLDFDDWLRGSDFLESLFEGL